MNRTAIKIESETPVRPLESIVWIMICIIVAVWFVDKDDVQIHWSKSKDQCTKIMVKGEDVGCQEILRYRRYLTDRIWGE